MTHPPRTSLTTEPDWAPDGRWLVYTLYRHDDTEHGRLRKIRSDGTHRVNLGRTCRKLCDSDGFAMWAPHGRRLVFERALGDFKMIALFTMHADGTHLHRVTQPGASPRHVQRFEDLAPTWSPNGRRIAFERHNRTTDHHAIFTVRLDGTGLRRLTPWRLDASQPDYAPDGRWLVFRSHETSDTRGDLYLVTPRGRHLHPITHEAPGTQRKWGSVSFSPDGKHITASSTLFSGSGDHLADVYTMRRDGSHVRDLTRTPHQFESASDWGPRPH